MTTGQLKKSFQEQIDNELSDTYKLTWTEHLGSFIAQVTNLDDVEEADWEEDEETTD